ncbi:RNA polymerase sigma factor SigZ [Thalassomonas sp. RHCl1]|uniref:RNA polymerase sigma factor SigZ n=1 Tax=Thalassomonas sp. RHCl1 TaxID=2995320 RepID=UPI00248AB700|nr:RNA polymerase sigma factor SigZ [Thalassomonas sp. RHCl1]
MLTEWKNHKAQLRSYIDMRLDDPDVVDDILQEVYIKASSNLHQLKVRGSLKSWLYRITHNLIMDHYRAHHSYDELPESLASEEQDPIEENYKTLALCLKPLIGELPDKYRIPLQLAELEGLSQQDIADKLGLSLSGAKSRVQRGRKKFRELMMSHCDFEIGKGGVTDFAPKDDKGKMYYKTLCK